MSVKSPLAIVIVLAAAVGYLLGTDSGRHQRDVILVKLRRGEHDAEQLTDAVTEAGEQLSEAVAATGEQVSDTMADANAEA